MTDIPDEAVVVGARALSTQRGDACESQTLREHFASLVLDAATHIIRADERQRIAEEIRAYIAEYRHAYALPGNPYAEGFTTGLEAFSEAHLTERNGK